MFAVKVCGIEKLVKGVRSFIDLEFKVGNLNKLKTQIEEKEKSNQSYVPFNVDQNPAAFNIHPSRTTYSSTPKRHNALSLNAQPGALNPSPSSLNAHPSALNVPPLKGDGYQNA